MNYWGVLRVSDKIMIKLTSGHVTRIFDRDVRKMFAIVILQSFIISEEVFTGRNCCRMQTLADVPSTS
ncbi:hypothetical protein DPMN_006558 [Dreissena polymorpha]|uniref:Uncharacterized protein n=1 Tax=Dreissena polymorpha TaxID=45954 RepID=A0A9D4RV21_DREPO|nr:hypothetical protein DPMN_006558 [Dreissena polymorpha]